MIYAGNSETKSVNRDQAKEKIMCEDKRFDEMFCVFDRDMEKLLKACLNEKEAKQTWAWFKGEKSEEEKEADNQRGE